MTPRRLSAIASVDVATLIAAPTMKQLVRYAFAGFCVTQFAAAIYTALALVAGVHPLLANVASTACGLCAGYLAHSRFSFAGHGSGSERLQVFRFLVTAGFAFLINSMWVWLLVMTLRLSAVAPVPLMMLVTPWISFMLNRHWVFSAADSRVR